MGDLITAVTTRLGLKISDLIHKKATVLLKNSSCITHRILNPSVLEDNLSDLESEQVVELINNEDQAELKYTIWKKLNCEYLKANKSKKALLKKSMLEKETKLFSVLDTAET